MGSPGKVTRTQNSYVRQPAQCILVLQECAISYARQDYRAWEGPEFTAEMMAEMERLQAALEASGS
ncbi:hypothetical protein ACU4GD_12280 [Cupriavidus basilensis]